MNSARESIVALVRHVTKRLELPPGPLYKSLYYVHLFNHRILSYPHYSVEYIRENIEQKLEDVPRDELDIYNSFRSKPYKVILLVAAVHWIFISKALMFVFYSSLMADYGNPTSGLRQVSAQIVLAPFGLIAYRANVSSGDDRSVAAQNMTIFSCLLTNCTRLTTDPPEAQESALEHFANELIQLPVFAICKDHLRHYWNPLVYTQVSGLISACALAMFLFVITNLAPLWSLFNPTRAFLVLGALCPRISHQLARDLVRTQLKELFNSQMNFYVTFLPYQLTKHSSELVLHYRKVAVLATHGRSDIRARALELRQEQARAAARARGSNQAERMYDDIDKRPDWDIEMDEKRQAIEHLKLHWLDADVDEQQPGEERNDRFENLRGIKFRPSGGGDGVQALDLDANCRTVSIAGKHDEIMHSRRKSRKIEERTYESFLEDCLPLTATAWFRWNYSQVFMFTISAVLSGAASLLFLVTLYVAYPTRHKELFSSFALQMRLDECAIWRLFETSHEEGARDRIVAQLDLDNIFENWTWLQMIEWAGCLTLPIFMLCIPIVHFYLAMLMMNLEILDLKLQMGTLIELGELLNNCQLLSERTAEQSHLNGQPTKYYRLMVAAMAALGPPTNYNDDEVDDDEGHERGDVDYESLRQQGQAAASWGEMMRPNRLTPMRRIRWRLFAMVERVLAFFPAKLMKRANGKPTLTKLDEHLAYQELAFELLLSENLMRDERAARALFLDLLERLHVNYRLFMRTFGEHDIPVSTCLLFSFLLNYGFATIGLFWFKTIKSFVALPLILAAAALFIGNALVVFCSRIHAAAGKLENKMWTLIRLLTGMEDERAKHLRYLWTKQLKLIDAGGGLALRMFGKINITYLVIIESVIWTSSLVLFTYTRKGF